MTMNSNSKKNIHNLPAIKKNHLYQQILQRLATLITIWMMSLISIYKTNKIKIKKRKKAILTMILTLISNSKKI